MSVRVHVESELLEMYVGTVIIAHIYIFKIHRLRLNTKVTGLSKTKTDEYKMLHYKSIMICSSFCLFY